MCVWGGGGGGGWVGVGVCVSCVCILGFSSLVLIRGRVRERSATDKEIVSDGS